MIWEMFRLQGELLLAVTYGYHVRGCDDRLLAASKRRVKFAVERVLPGTLLINHIPLCMYFFFFAHRKHDRLSANPSVRYIPEWVPWFSYKPLIRVGRDLGNQLLYPPFHKVKECMVSNYFFQLINILE